MTLDPAIADLLKAITEALAGVADWRAVAVTVATERARNGFDDPGAAADWLREFLAEREATQKRATELLRGVDLNTAYSTPGLLPADAEQPAIKGGGMAI